MKQNRKPFSLNKLHCYPILCLIVLHGLTSAGQAQIPNFYKPPVLPDLSSPQPATLFHFPNYGPVSNLPAVGGYAPPIPLSPTPFADDRTQQRKQREQIQQDIEEADQQWKQATYNHAQNSYRSAYAFLSRLNPDSFSLAQAVFIVENAFADQTLNYQDYTELLQIRADMVKQYLKKQGLSLKSDLALNYGIQRLFKETLSYTDPKDHQTHWIKPFIYDLEDYEGKIDLSKQFVSKLLAKGNGQCHSMPLAYLMIAEAVGAKAWLSYAPKHIYIQFKDSRGRLTGFETTNGNIASTSWVMGSSYITNVAIRNGTYMDTVSERKLYAQVLDDLLNGYLRKFGFDDFSEAIKHRILSIDSSNLTALMFDCNLKYILASQALDQVAWPKKEELHNYPEANLAFQNFKTAQAKITQSGYQEMPDYAYQDWLKSVDEEKLRRARQQPVKKNPVTPPPIHSSSPNKPLHPQQ